MPDTALVVMARYPEVGATKTRLARMIGVEGAVHLYRAFLTDLARKFAGQPYDLHWAYTPNGVDYSAFMATLAPSLAPPLSAAFRPVAADYRGMQKNPNSRNAAAL